MIPDVFRENVTLAFEGIKDVFYGVFQYYKYFKSDDTRKDEPSDLQIFGWSKLKSLLFWIIFVNGFLFGGGHVILGGILAVLEFMVLKVCGSLFPESSQYVWNILCPAFVSWFPFLWIIPLFTIIKFANFLWFQDIAELTQSKTKTRRRKPSIGFSRFAADYCFTVLLELCFLAQCSCTMILPDVGYILSTCQLALLYSMYAFEYKWTNCGIELPERIEMIERNISYFLGFGLPLAVVTSAANSYMWSACVFSFIFPWYIISGNTVKPSISRHRYRIRVFGGTEYVAKWCFKLMGKLYRLIFS